MFVIDCLIMKPFREIYDFVFDMIVVGDFCDHNGLKYLSLKE